MNRKPLSSLMGQTFALISYGFLLGAVVIIIYSAFVKYWPGLIAGIVFGVFNYIIFGRKLLRTKSITFDENYFYFKDASKIELSQIQNIENAKITYINDGSEKIIYVNPFFLSKNHQLFYKYFKQKN
ncbi:hypothetical protein ADIWIN_3853 [Winogradskyella psychrotolerans RS-3]|uniref:Uncharacterized protein n=1 Tax=Winogradskyella psychrotolerans RS-3 TaxID=641526 RepID=S7VIC4_9FLAO|nr:hypothetical protein [Winogradskyella psychrotolerans]EPR69990.1 hypothetical protein ADIWIN_3853 [Winogradskyella psychrotolerans RS-3]